MNHIGRTAVVLAVASVVATVGVYSLGLVPLLFSGALAITTSRPVVFGILAVFFGITVVRTVLVHRLAPHEQAFVRFWVHAPFFTFLIACTVGSLLILLALSTGPRLGWSPSTVSWVVRAIGLIVLVLSALFMQTLSRRHQASAQNPPPSAGARAA